MALDAMARPQSVFNLQRELGAENARRYTNLTMGEKLRLHIDELVNDTKSQVQKVRDVTRFGAPVQAVQTPGPEQGKAAAREKN